MRIPSPSFMLAHCGRPRLLAGVALAACVAAPFAQQASAQQPGQYTQYAPNGPPQTYPQQPVYSYGPQGYAYPQAQSYAQQPYQPQYAPQQQPQPYGHAQPQYAQPQYTNQYTQPQYSQPQYPQPQYAQPQQAAPQGWDAARLEQLAAPIALYPDALVAQVLAAATYPEQVAQADRWEAAQGAASPYDIAGAADSQPWDPSVKALTAFPQVLAELDRNLRWTTDLGTAYYNQPQDVLQAIQVLRQRAQSAGTLRSSPQETVEYNDGAIQLAPPTPQVVYVPEYNPWTTYGPPLAPYPGFTLLDAFGAAVGTGLNILTAPLQFGAGIFLQAFNHTPWGFFAWGLSWLTHEIFFNHAGYYSHSITVADWGLPHGGPRAFRSGYAGGGRYGYGGPQPRPLGSNYARGNLEAYPRMPAGADRGFNAARGGYNSYPSPAQRAYSPSPAYGRNPIPQTAYRAPEAAPSRGFFASNARPAPFAGNSGSRVYGNSYASQSNAGGFLLFDHGSSQHYNQPSFKQPRYSAPKMTGGSHWGGGHSSGHSGGGIFSGHGNKHHG